MITRFGYVASVVWLVMLLGPVVTRVRGDERVKATEPKQDEEQIKEVTVEDYDSETEGAVQVKGETGDNFRLYLDGTAVKGNAVAMNGTVAVLPGTYEVLLNMTKRTVKVEAGKKTVLVTGTLMVTKRKANFWAPYQGKERMVSGNPRPPGASMALFAGTYRVELNVAINKPVVVLADEVKVVAGKKTVVE